MNTSSKLFAALLLCFQRCPGNGGLHRLRHAERRALGSALHEVDGGSFAASIRMNTGRGGTPARRGLLGQHVRAWHTGRVRVRPVQPRSRARPHSKSRCGVTPQPLSCTPHPIWTDEELR